MVDLASDSIPNLPSLITFPRADGFLCRNCWL